MKGNFKNIIFFSLCFAWNPVFAVGLAETATAVGIANTLEGARGSQGNPNQVINNVKDTLKKAEDSRPKLDPQGVPVTDEVAQAQATQTDLNQAKAKSETEATGVKAEAEAVKREAGTEATGVKAEAEAVKREAGTEATGVKAETEAVKREAGTEVVGVEAEAEETKRKAKMEEAKRETIAKAEAEIARREAGIKSERELAEQNTLASVEHESPVYKEDLEQETLYDVVSERKPAGSSFKAVKTLVFYKKDCKDSNPSNCTRSHPVFTNLKNVMFDYHNKRLDFQK